MEHWKVINGFEDSEVSNLCNVRNRGFGNLLKGSKLDLFKNGKKSRFARSKLVASHFSPDELQVWKTVEGFDNYEVSILGDVRNKTSGHILKGNSLTLLSNERVRKQCRRARLVALHFLAVPDDVEDCGV